MPEQETAGYESARHAWREARLSPLWESAVAFKERGGAPKPLHWPWDAVRPLIDRAIELVSPRDVERRVLMFTDPELNTSRRAMTTLGLNAGLQILLPGESAHPHRHSMDAIRFVLEGDGAVTVVDGKEYPMAEGDLILTPGWCWHEHIHRGARPVIWLDGLNSPLHRYLGTAAFEPGPPPHLPDTIPDGAYSVAGMIPLSETEAHRHSPVFRYSYATARAVAAAAPAGQDGARRVRYANPSNGGPAMALMDHQLMQVDPGIVTRPMRATSNAICVVVEGRGSSQIGTESFKWGPKDVFTLPQGNWISHRTDGETAYLFIYSDREVYARLGLLKEEYGNQSGRLSSVPNRGAPDQ